MMIDDQTESSCSFFKHSSLSAVIWTNSKSLSIIKSQVAQAHYERSAYISLFPFAYIMSRQNIRPCMENATKVL